jgi:purine-cytosine permease-like protein
MSIAVYTVHTADTSSVTISKIAMVIISLSDLTTNNIHIYGTYIIINNIID